jgi:hypothetical protein
VETSALILGGKSIEAGPLLDVDPFFIAWRKQFCGARGPICNACYLSYPLVCRGRWLDELGGF